jgi:gliding motility-associated-like protein
MLVRVAAGIFVPTAFTPNDDGLNDRWRIPFLDPSLEGTVSVYNSFGQRVYHVSSGVVDWDGKTKGNPQPIGTYVYHITFKNGRPALKGTFSLIR